MSKAILVIDMPSDCLNCPLYHGDFEHRCKPTHKINHDCFNKPDWCPLKEIPTKKKKGMECVNKIHWALGILMGKE